MLNRISSPVVELLVQLQGLPVQFTPKPQDLIRHPLMFEASNRLGEKIVRYYSDIADRLKLFYHLNHSADINIDRRPWVHI
jgi:hypothetical protein